VGHGNGATNPRFSEALVASSMDALLAISPAGEVLTWNPGAGSMFGITSEQAVGRELQALFEPDARGGDAKLRIREAIVTACQSGSARLESSVVKPNGAIIRVDVAMNAVKSAAGGVEFITVIQKEVAAAMATLQEFKPSVLVTDLGMPKEDGYDLIRQVRLTSTVPAVALTAYADEEHRRRVLSSGFQMHIPKPVKPEALLDAIAQLARA
jgi:PAS domain S-box-containing protein